MLRFKGEGVQVPGGKLYVSLCHYAMRRWKNSHRPDSWHLYGHSHGGLPEWKNMSFDVGIMLTEWQPCPWESIVARMKEKIAAGHAPTEHHEERR
jgi:calcineurin-like phosphoesterase family protein